MHSDVVKTREPSLCLLMISIFPPCKGLTRLLSAEMNRAHAEVVKNIRNAVAHDYISNNGDGSIDGTDLHVGGQKSCAKTEPERLEQLDLIADSIFDFKAADDTLKYLQ